MEGSKVYVNDEVHGWLKATLLRVNAETAEVELEADDVIGIAGGELRSVDMSHPDLMAVNDGHGVGAKTSGAAAAAGLPLQNLRLPALGVEDLSSLGFLHAPALLFTVRTRHLAQQPYTWSSNIIISVNPYEELADLYSDESKTAYALAKSPSELPPHIYAISATAYHGLGGETGENQSILVSGESGAGKTEVCKQIMAHLATIASADGGTKEDNSIVTKVLESNPLLESFGNAQTVRNDNSSRFGKFTQLHFHQQAGKKPVLVGSKCDTYLLEGSRVVHHSMGERGFHVFYQLLAAPEEVKARVGLSGKTVKDFHYMVCDHGGSKTSEIEGESDSVRFQATAHALSLVGLETEEQEQLWGVLAGILHLGQVQFQGEEGTSGDEEARIKEAASDESGGGALEQAAALLLGDEGGALGKALCQRTVKTRTETYAVPMTPAQAVDARWVVGWEGRGEAGIKFGRLGRYPETISTSLQKLILSIPFPFPPIMKGCVGQGSLPAPIRLARGSHQRQYL
jgi:myosin-5